MPAMTTIQIKRAYEKPAKDDGYRILVDRLWPRGLKKETAKIHLWLKEIAPSNELREWFKHESDKWPEFKKRYHKELKTKKDLIKVILDKSKQQTVTLLFGAKDVEHNNAIVLLDYLEKI